MFWWISWVQSFGGFRCFGLLFKVQCSLAGFLGLEFRRVRVFGLLFRVQGWVPSHVTNTPSIAGGQMIVSNDSLQ